MWGLFAFAQPPQFEPTEEAVPVEVVSDAPREMTKGVKTAQKVIPNAPERVDKVADLRKDNDPGEEKTDTSSIKPPSKQEETVKDDPAKVEPAKAEPVKIPDPPTRPPEPPRVASLPTPLPTPRPQPAKPQSATEDDPTDDKDAEIIREQKKKEQQKAEQQKLIEDQKRKQEQAKQEQAKQELAKKIAEQQAADAKAKADAEAKKLAEAQKQEEARKLAEKIAADQAKAEAEAKKQAELKKKDAEAKAKAVAEAKKAAEERKRQEAAEAQPSFDPNAIRNKLLASREKPTSSGATGAQISREASLGTQTGSGAKLSPSDREALAGILQDQITKCWSVNVTTSPSTKPIVKIELSADGQITGGPVLTNSSNDPNFRPVAESGMRAIRQCAPYRIPAKYAQYYNDWKTLNVRLDPSDLL